MLRYFTTLSQHKELKMQKSCVATKDNYVMTQNPESALKGKRTLSRQTQHKVEVNSVAIKTSIVMKKAEKNYKTNVVTLKIMS